MVLPAGSLHIGTLDITWPLNQDAFINWNPVVSHNPHWDGGQICLHRMRLNKCIVYCSVKAKVRLLWSRSRFPWEILKKRQNRTSDINPCRPSLVCAFTPSPSTCNVEKYPLGVFGYNVSAFKKITVKMTSDGSRGLRGSWWEVDACSCWCIIRTDTSTCSRWSYHERCVGSNSRLDVL